jgi:pSer/pThr/pTyr-binding forkhead associated (FHA) protein
MILAAFFGSWIGVVMANVTFLVLEGVDKGRVYRQLTVPVTIGREEGNALRLNDERVSRYHAKVQTEDGDVILTDLESTNGTRVNGSTIQIRRLRAGDQVSIGRTLLLFGTMEEIEARRTGKGSPMQENGVQTIQAGELAAAGRTSDSSQSSSSRRVEYAPTEWRARDEDVPPLPQKLSGSQSARLAEIFDYLHRGLTTAVENIEANEDGTEVTLGFNEWQTVQAVQLLLARYTRSIGEPEVDR